jgi:hypothetical protein
MRGMLELSSRTHYRPSCFVISTQIQYKHTVEPSCYLHRHPYDLLGTSDQLLKSVASVLDIKVMALEGKIKKVSYVDRIIKRACTDKGQRQSSE